MGVYYWIKGIMGLVMIAILFPFLMIVADITHTIFYAMHEALAGSGGGSGEARALFERLFSIIATGLSLVIPLLMIAFFLYIVVNSARRDGREEVVYG